MKAFRELRAKTSQQARAVAERLFKDMLRSYPLAALRGERGLTQADVASRLNMSQAAISKLESRKDFLLSTFDRYVRATGGEVRISVAYSDGTAFRIDRDSAANGLVLRPDFPTFQPRRSQAYPIGDATRVSNVGPQVVDDRIGHHSVLGGAIVFRTMNPDTPARRTLKSHGGPR
jgi:transcriptional regulator with XRE-family HTH domain